jgi:hypothetical protein
MKNEKLSNVFIPLKDNDWFLIKTDSNTYSLRFGGYKIEHGVIDFSKYEDLQTPFSDHMIKNVYSDDYWMFILLDNDGVISAGEVDISISGKTKLGVQFEKVSDFDEGFFGSRDLFELINEASGWSIKVTQDGTQIIKKDH